MRVSQRAQRIQPFYVMEMAKADSGPVVLVRLYVEEHNGRAQAFYQGMGMADEGYRVWAWKTR